MSRELVLRDNYLQTQSITVTNQLGGRLLDRLGRFMRRLERDGRLDRKIEFLPDDEELADRQQRGAGFARPEISVLLSYAKMTLYDELLASDLPDDAAFAADLAAYFPTPLRERFAQEIATHRLRREIVATVVTNDIVNRVGITFVHEVKEKTGLSSADVARGYVASRRLFDLRKIWTEIESLDNRVPAAVQMLLLTECGRLVDRGTVWCLRHENNPLDIESVVATHRGAVRELAGLLGETLAPAQARALDERADALAEQGAPPELARRVAQLAFLAPACDISRLVRESEQPLEHVARIYFDVGARFGFDWLRTTSARLPSETAWNKLAVTALVEDLDDTQYELTRRILSQPEQSNPIQEWAQGRALFVTRTEQLLAELQSMAHVDLAMIAVAGRQLKAMNGG